MAIDYVMPKLAMAMNEGTINEWMVKQGQYVEKGDILMDLETEKVSYDAESPESGFINIIISAGETVDVETLVAQFAETEEELKQLESVVTGGASRESSAIPQATTQTEPSSQSKPTTPSGRIKASPLARKMAKDANLDLSQICGTGPGGRIVKRDILAAHAQPATIATAATLTRPAGLAEKARIPFKGVRTKIADRMVQSLQSTAQLSAMWESDITDLLDVRRSLVAKEEKLGTRVSMNALLIKAITIAIKQVPIANSALDGDDIVIYEDVNIGIALAMPGQTEFDSQLMVPVLKGVNRMSVIEIDKAMKALISRTRNSELGADEMSGSTITLSSTAGIGPPGLKNTPILNLPNAVLIGPSTPIERPAVLNGEVVPRTLMPVSLTFDHRVLDGEPAARFMNHLHECLENPELLLM